MSDVGCVPREQKTMTKQSYLKQEIRARMAITGESYSAAARAIAKEQSLPSESSAPESTPPERAELRSLVIFTERLAVLLSGAITMRAAFEISEQTTEDPALKRGIQEVLAEHDAGEPMERAIADRPWAFPGIFSAVISNGVRNGSFYDSMKQMAQLYRTEMELEAPKHMGSERTAAKDRLEARIRAEEKGLLRLDIASPNPEVRAEARRLKEIQEDPFNWRANDPRPLAVYIGLKHVGVALARVQTDWKFIHCETPEHFLNFLEHGDIKSDEVCSILVLDGYYSANRSGEDFERLGATMAPCCLFGIVSYDAELREPIRTAIAEAAVDASSPEGEVYFIDSDRPKSSLDEAIDDFLLAEPELAKSALDAIAHAR